METKLGKGRKSQIGAILLAVVLLLGGVLSACSSGGNGKATNTGSGSPASTQDRPSSGSASSEEPAADKSISLLLSHSGAVYTKEVSDWENDPYVKELERLSGYDLQYEFLGHTPDFIPQLTTRFASGDLPDLIRTEGIEGVAHPGAVDQGVFLELGALIDQYGPNLKKLIPESMWNSPRVQKDGKIFGIPASNGRPFGRIMYIRQDLLDKYGLQAPVTVEDWLAYFETIKKNEPDIIPFVGRENMFVSEIFFGAHGVFPTLWSEVDGQFIPDMIRPEMKEPIRLWRSIYEKGYVNENIFTNKAADWNATILQGKAASWFHSASDYNNFALPEGAKAAILPGMIGPAGTPSLFPMSDNIYFVFVIPADTKNPEEIIKFLDWAWSSEQAKNFWDYGIEGSNYTVDNGKIVWDPASPNNDNQESDVYRLSLNVTGNGLASVGALAVLPNNEIIMDGITKAELSAIDSPTKYMPQLKAFATNPELVPGFGAGTLFLDMFAKVVTGREDVDSAFDAFVAEWKQRGGDAAIAEATDWYNRTIKR